jgi:hypothetical protein
MNRDPDILNGKPAMFGKYNVWGPVLAALSTRPASAQARVEAR